MKINYHLLTLLAIVFCSMALAGNASTDDPTDNARFGYIQNKGQIHDQNGIARSDIRFMYYDDQFKLILRNTGFSYEFVKTDYLQSINTESGTPIEIKDENKTEYTWQYTVNRVDIELVNANKNVEVISEGQSPFYRNYFNEHTGPGGIKDIHSFFRVTYKNVYNGIDLVFSSEKNADGKIFPKYEFIVYPNGKIADIALNYNGDFDFSIRNNGDLKVNTGIGYAVETQPVILFSDARAPEKGKFIRHGNTISFGNVKRNSSETITIDPTVEWGTYWGGEQKDLTDEIAVDLNNNAVVTGRTRSSASVATAGSYQSTNAGGLDIPLLKWDPSGNLLFGTYYGGDKNEIGFCITVDPFNQIWIGGHTFSTSGIATPGALQTVFGGGNSDDFDGVLAKWSNDGSLLYGTYLGGVGQDEFQNIWADTDGSIYASGLAEALTGIIYSPCYDCTGDTVGDNILMRFDNAGHQIWATYSGGAKRDRGHGVTVSGNNVYQCGTVESPTGVTIGNPGGNAFQPVYQGAGDMFIGRWNKNTGVPIWVTYFGGSGGERGRDIRCDRYGDIYFVGQTESGADGLATPGAWKQGFTYSPLDRDGIVVKFDSNCNKIFATYFGGNKIEMPRTLRVGPEGAPIYVGGYTKSDSGLVTSDAFDIKNKKNNDAFWLRFNWDMSDLQYCTYFGGKKSESVTEPGWYGPSIEVDASSNVYVSSGTNSPDEIAFGNSYRDSLFQPGQFDFFITKFRDPCPDGFEPNDEFIMSTVLKFRNSHKITRYAPVQEKGDKDYFTFNLPDGLDNIKITLSNLPFDLNLFVYDSLQNLLGKSVSSGLTAEAVTLNNTYSGRYYVLVKSPTLEFGNICYKLNVSANDEPFRLSEESALGTLSLFPNPAGQSTLLQFDCELSGSYQVDICDLQGKVIIPMQYYLPDGRQSIALNVEKFSAGTYLVKVSGFGINDFVKLVIQK
ncbi:MAG: T9SS type A sorting domain-containing protein [Chitinophagales bacterium]